MSEVLPLFKSHYSVGKSILTLYPQGSSDGTGPDSVIDICADNKLDHFYLVDDSMTGFREAYQNSLEAKIDLRFGLIINIIFWNLCFIFHCLHQINFMYFINIL